MADFWNPTGPAVLFYSIASIGITLFPHDATHAGQLLKNADIAMYQAKVAGKNCYRFYSRALDRAVERRVQLEQDLRGAWDRGVDQQLTVVVDGLVTELLKHREAARERQDFAAADAIRDSLAALGVEVSDTPQGPRWRVR